MVRAPDGSMPLAPGVPGRRRTGPILAALARAAVVVAVAAAFAAVSLGAAVVALTVGSVLVLAWSYRRPWSLGWVRGLSPALAASLTLASQAILPVPGLVTAVSLGAGVGGALGLFLGLRHGVARRARSLVARPAWAILLLWGAGLVLGQAAALSGDAELAGGGVVAASVGAGLAAMFFLSLSLKGLLGRGSAPTPGRLGASVGAALLLALAPLWGSVGAELSAQTGLRPGLWTGSLDPERKAAAIARVTSADVSYECSDVAVRIDPDGSVRIEGGFQCSIVLSENRRRGELQSSAHGYLTSYAPGGPGSAGEIPMSLEVVRRIRFEFVDGRPPRVTETSSRYERPARLESTPDGGALRLYVYNGADAVAVVPWLLRLAAPAVAPAPPVTPGPGPSPGPDPGPDPRPDPEPGYEPDPTDDPDPLPPPPAGYVPRHLLIEGGEQAGLLMGLAALLAGLVSSLAAGLGPGAATVAGSALEGGVPDGAGGTSPRSPATGAGGLEWDGLLEAVRRQRIEWLASGGQLPEAVAGSSPLGPWSRDGYRTMRGAVEAVHRAVQELRSPGDIHDPSRMKQDEMEDVHRFETMRRATFAGRVVRATVAGGGDVAPDPAPGLRGAVTGALHAFWDAAFPDPTSLAESMVDPQNEYRDLVDAWRKSQTLSRWIRTFTPREPSGIPALIQNLLDERMAEQKAHTGDEEYFDTEYPKWQAELDALKAMEAWSKRGGGAP